MSPQLSIIDAHALRKSGGSAMSRLASSGAAKAAGAAADDSKLPRRPPRRLAGRVTICRLSRRFRCASAEPASTSSGSSPTRERFNLFSRAIDEMKIELGRLKPAAIVRKFRSVNHLMSDSKSPLFALTHRSVRPRRTLSYHTAARRLRNWHNCAPCHEKDLVIRPFTLKCVPHEHDVNFH